MNQLNNTQNHAACDGSEDLRAYERERGHFYSDELRPPQCIDQSWHHRHPDSRFPEAFHALTGRIWGPFDPCPRCKRPRSEAKPCHPQAGVGAACGECGVMGGQEVIAGLLGLSPAQAEQAIAHWMDTGEAQIPDRSERTDDDNYGPQERITRRAERRRPRTQQALQPRRDWREEVDGRMPEILQALGGVSPDQLTNRHQPCPACGGTDRFRWDSDDGKGSAYCNQCGGRNRTGGGMDGMGLLERVTGKSFADLAREVEEYLGIPPRRPQRRQPPPAITLARLPEPLPEAPPDHLPAGQRINYSPTQWTTWEDGTRTGQDGEIKTKGERPRHIDASGKTQYRAGSDPWPLFGSEHLPHAKGKWIVGAEGPKCARWLQAGGLVGVSQPGHDHKGKSITRRFRELQAADIAGMVYLADNDDAGLRKAQQLADCAREVGFNLLVIRAASVWPDIPEKGSIDDAPGTATERVEAFVAAVAADKAEPLGPAADTRRPKGDHAVAVAAATGIEAVTLAPGSGWVEDENGHRHRSALAGGDLSRVLAEQLGNRLGFDELNLLPAVDGQTLTGPEIDLLHIQLQERGWKIGKAAAIDGLMRAAHLAPFHPVRQYLEGLEANDSIEPIDRNTFGPDYWRVDDPLHCRFLWVMVLGAVWRAMEPSTDFKTAVVLQSERQTLFKSRSLEALASPEWFCDTGQDGDKDLLLAVHTCWIYELAEIETLTSKKDAGKLKNLLSSKRDTFRPPYGTGMVKKPRSSVFIGTCNRDDFLVDETGNTRFLIVKINKQIDYRKIERDRDMIWKAAMQAYRAGERPWLSEADLALSEIQNQDFTPEHEWTAPVAAWLRGDRLEPHKRQGHLETLAKGFTINDCLVGSRLRPFLDRIEAGRDGRRLAGVLKALGCTRGTGPIRREGERVRVWFPPEAGTRGTPGTRSSEQRVPSSEPSGGNGSGEGGTPGTPLFSEKVFKGGEQVSSTAHDHPQELKGGKIGVPRVPRVPSPAPQGICPGTRPGTASRTCATPPWLGTPDDRDSSRGTPPPDRQADTRREERISRNPAAVEQTDADRLWEHQHDRRTAHQPDPFWPSPAPPPWLPQLRELLSEQPDAAAYTLAIQLDPGDTGKPTGREVAAWLARLRADRHQEAA
ncbi:MAG: VapE domain-containing protein [Cyanobacteria bacterium J06638_7]